MYSPFRPQLAAHAFLLPLESMPSPRSLSPGGLALHTFPLSRRLSCLSCITALYPRPALLADALPLPLPHFPTAVHSFRQFLAKFLISRLADLCLQRL